MTLTCSHALLVLMQANHGHLWLHHKGQRERLSYDLNLQLCPSGPDAGKPWTSLAVSQRLT